MVLSTSGAVEKSAESPARGHRPLLCNDDGAIMNLEPPVTANHLREMVRSYAGTPVDALMWCVGDREVYYHDTKVAEVFGRRHTTFDNAGDWRIHENTRSFIESGKCVLATLAEICHQEGLRLVPSVRMNSHYEVDPKSPHHSRFRLEHPEFLIGHPEGYDKGSKEHSIRRGLNYARPEVRHHISAILVELFENFEVDGVEMDFMRHPTFFKLHEAVENSYLMTDMLRRIRKERDRVSQATGRKIDLVARVPPTFSDALRVGLDVRSWIREGLVDVLVAGGGFIPFDMPFEEFVREARGTNCQVYGSLELFRLLHGPTVAPRISRAIAMRYWKAGAAGLHLFNYFAQPTPWKQQLFREIANPQKLEQLDKRYQIDTRRWSPKNWEAYGGAFGSAIPAVQLPVSLVEASGKGPELTLRIADDLESAQAGGSLSETRLRLQFDNYTSGDEIEVTLNGHRLPHGSSSNAGLVEFWNKNSRPDQGRFLEGTIEYKVGCPPLRSGDNTIQVRINTRNSNVSAPLTLSTLEVAVSYAPE